MCSSQRGCTCQQGTPHMPWRHSRHYKFQHYKERTDHRCPCSRHCTRNHSLRRPLPENWTGGDTRYRQWQQKNLRKSRPYTPDRPLLLQPLKTFPQRMPSRPRLGVLRSLRYNCNLKSRRTPAETKPPPTSSRRSRLLPEKRCCIFLLGKERRRSSGQEQDCRTLVSRRTAHTGQHSTSMLMGRA